MAELKARINENARNTEVEVPEACAACSEIAFPLSTDNRYRRCATPDAWAQPLRVEIKDAYDSMIIGPYKDAYGACKAELSRSERYHPIRLMAEGSGAYGLSGVHVHPAIYIETGKRWKFGIGGIAPIDIYGGQVFADGAIAVRLRYRIWPR